MAKKEKEKLEFRIGQRVRLTEDVAVESGHVTMPKGTIGKVVGLGAEFGEDAVFVGFGTFPLKRFEGKIEIIEEEVKPRVEVSEPAEEEKEE